MTHRLSFYQQLNKDPSGLRHIPYVDDILYILFPPSGWIGMKYHDVHHAFSTSMGEIMTRCHSRDWKKLRNFSQIWLTKVFSLMMMEIQSATLLRQVLNSVVESNTRKQCLKKRIRLFDDIQYS